MSVSLQQVKGRFQQLSQPAPLRAVSLRNFELFQSLGFPDRKNENWKYTNVHAVLPMDVHFVAPASNLKVSAGASFVFQNGHLISAPSIPRLQWRSLGSGTLTEADMDQVTASRFPDDGFEALSLSAPSEVLFIEVPAGAVFENAVNMEFRYEFSSEESLCQPLIFLRVGKGAELHLLEDVHASGAGLVNGLTTILVEDGAHVHHVRRVQAGEHHRNLADYEVFQGRDSFFQTSSFNFGGKILRHSVTVHQQEAGAETVCNGLYLTKNKEHMDFRVNLRHLKPHGTSRQLYKGVLKDASRAVFNGKIYIEKGAQKTDSSQLNNNLVLSRQAEADSKPELEVYADDVKANHGSAIGQLDQDQLFYLMSRAIAKDEAVRILARGFVEEVVLKVKSQPLREKASEWMLHSLVDFQQSLEQSKGFAQ